MKRVRSVSTPNIKPVFALGGSVSSMGSAEKILTGSGEDLNIWRIPEVVVDYSDNFEDTGSYKRIFKSSFAKELELKSATESFINVKLNDKKHNENCLSCNTSGLDSGLKSLGDKEEDTLVLAQAVEEFLRVKAENERLKTRMKTCKQGDQRYQKLEQEVEHLTWQLRKVIFKIQLTIKI